MANIKSYFDQAWQLNRSQANSAALRENTWKTINTVTILKAHSWATTSLRACLHGGGVTRVGARLYIQYWQPRNAGVNVLDTIAWWLITRFETHPLLLEVSLQRSKLFSVSRRLLEAMLSGLNLAEFERSLELHRQKLELSSLHGKTWSRLRGLSYSPGARFSKLPITLLRPISRNYQ